MWLLRHYPATQMSSFTFLTPVFALVFGVALLNEPLTIQLMLALCSVAAGIVLVNRRARRYGAPQSGVKPTVLTSPAQNSVSALSMVPSSAGAVGSGSM